MGILNWFKKPQPVTGDHAVILHIRLGNDEFGLPGEADVMHALQDELIAALNKARAGELDGDEFGQGECVIYMYGPDAGRLFDAVAPVLGKHPFRKGSHAIKRHGPPGEGKAESVNLYRDG